MCLLRPWPLLRALSLSLWLPSVRSRATSALARALLCPSRVATARDATFSKYLCRSRSQNTRCVRSLGHTNIHNQGGPGDWRVSTEVLKPERDAALEKLDTKVAVTSKTTKVACLDPGGALCLRGRSDSIMLIHPGWGVCR